MYENIDLRVFPQANRLTKIEMDTPGFQMKVNIFFEQLEEELTDQILECLKEKNLENEEWKDYNIFTFEDEPIQKLKDKILEIYDEFIELAGIEKEEEIWLNGWFNKLAYQEELANHTHSCHKNSHFSCNIVLHDCESAAVLLIPWSDQLAHHYYHNGYKGSLTIFPQWLWHCVPPISDMYRYSIGLDIHNGESIKDYFDNHHDENPAAIQHSIKVR